MVKGGLTKEESAQVIKILKEEGVLDFVSIIVGSYYSLSAITPAMGGPIGLAVEAANYVRDIAGLPVVVAGRIPTPEHAEEVIASEKADFVAFARPFIADPNWPNKFLAGKSETIYPCLYCNQQCVTRLSQKLPLSCVQNPSAGKEKLLEISNQSSLNKKHICVIGGGPAGIEAAISLRKAGFAITLIEKSQRLGGRLLLAAEIPGRQEWLNVIKPRIAVLEELEIEVRLETEADSKLLDAINPDGVIFAVGAKPWKSPQYRGEMNSGLFSKLNGSEFSTIDDLIDAPPRNKNIVLIDETGRRSVVALVDWLLELGNQVSVVTSFPYLGYPAMVLSQEWAIARDTFKKDGITVHPFTKVTEIDDSGAINVLNVLSGLPENLGKFDQMVLAFGDESRNLSFIENYQHWKVGDCASPRDIGAALSDGQRVANIVKEHFMSGVK
jgi:rhodanese-related sulfurtransferase